MVFQWSDFALRSLEEILVYYETVAGLTVAQDVEQRIFEQVEQMHVFPMALPASDIFPGLRKLVISRLPYVAFIRPLRDSVWEVVDIVHTSRKLPKNEGLTE